jgi:hypothetical protein
MKYLVIKFLAITCLIGTGYWVAKGGDDWWQKALPLSVAGGIGLNTAESIKKEEL